MGFRPSWARVITPPLVTISGSLSGSASGFPAPDPTGIFVRGCPLASSRKSIDGRSISIRAGMILPWSRLEIERSVETRSAENQAGESPEGVSWSRTPVIPADFQPNHQLPTSTLP